MLRLYFHSSSDSRADAHALLRRALCEDFHLSSPVFTHMPGGKPMLDGGHPQFNLSHSGPFALCGIGDTPLGVDVEAIRPRRPGLARRILSDPEWEWYANRGERWEDFYLLWTLKESLVKCTGRGLDCAPRHLTVPFLEVGDSVFLDGLWFRSYGGENWRAACCCEEPPPDLLFPASCRYSD